MNNSLAIYDNGRFDIMQRAAKAMAQSGFFKDTKDIAQAVTKVMAGAELGIPPFAAMTGIHLIQGKPALGANLIATLVKNDMRYDYRINRCNDTECELVWFEEGAEVGTSGFTMEEAKRAGLTGKDNWQKYPSDMLFARAISRGSRRFAPGIFGGAPVYTPDELGADVDPDGYIEGEVVPDYEPLDDGIDHDRLEAQIADLRAALETVDNPTLGLVAMYAADLGLYNASQHALNAIKKWPDLPEGVAVEMNKSVTNDTAVKIFDWLVDRK